ncbi:cation channel family protein [Polaribacter irgensii 23-P]|uniref:Cation channel family protein n=1 Tax=Polaribacter irgensii 23-P TaxID=313594 RepID=A4BZF6_9FLAO|nr:ion transporter [Polaribacter irgensii]EAR12549.1 cation channel family protein [Polaribacter irgensii 23-P]
MKKKVRVFINDNKYFIKFIYALIVLNVLTLILESYKELNDNYGLFFYSFEIFSVAIFTIEYLLRIWVSDKTKEDKKERLNFAFSTLGIIDLIAIIPFYLPFIFPFDLRIVRILRLFRLLRIFKLSRYSKSLKTIQYIFRETKAELSITVFVTFVLMILSSTLMYYIEHDAQPEKFASIGDAVWWAVATLTTVGYGDVYPVTALGKILSGIIALIGIGFVALPTGIISSAFIEKIQAEKKSKKGKKVKNKECCPTCGKNL